MKKITVSARNKRRDASTPDDVDTHGDDQEDDSGEAPTITLQKVGIKVEGEAPVEDPQRLVEEVVEAAWEEVPEPQLSQAYMVDLTQQFNHIFVQTTFSSFKEFEKLFNKFKAETGSVFRIKSSCSIEYENSRRKKHFIPSHFKFVTVRYCCVHYGQPKVAGQGIRTKQRYLPCGCESTLSLSYSRGALVISQANMQHNHAVSSEMAPFYAINRRISNAELQEVAGVVEMIPSSRALQHFLQIHFRRPTTLQDAKNVRSRLKALKTPSAAVTRVSESEESRLAAFEEEKEEEQDEDAVMNGVDDGVGFGAQEEVLRRDERGECDYWTKATICRSATQHYQEVKTEEMEVEKEPELDSALRREVLSEMKTRLFSVMEDCNARMFQERVSVIERLIEGWENGDPVHLQYIEESTPVNEYGTSISLPQGRTKNQNDCNENSHPSVNRLNVALSSMGTKGSNFRPCQTNKKLIKEHDNQVRVPNLVEIANGNSAEHQSVNGILSQYCNTETHHSVGMVKGKASQRRPIVLSIVKGFVGLCDQAMEVEIEVDGEEAKVKTVKREPLDYYEVLVTD